MNQDNKRSSRATKIFVAGLSYKTAPVEIREKVAIHPSLRPCYSCRLKFAAGLDEVVLLSTCNRVEIYGAGRDVQENVALLFQQICGDVDVMPYVYLKEGAEAAEHLFSVTSGLDSMVIGETEIAGQVKNAYLAAQKARLTGPFLNRLFQTAFKTSKDIRTHTAIGRGATSVGSVAVELVEKIFDRDLSEKTVMILGAGKMGEACVRHLAKSGARTVLVANRSLDRAETLASEFGGRALPFDERMQALVDADIVVSSTGCPTTVLHKDEIEAILPARRNRPLILIDIAVPRDIAADVNELNNVYLYNIDHLETIVRENSMLREQELCKCHEIIARHVAALMAKIAPAPVKARHEEVELVPGWSLGCFQFQLQPA
ncbi:MAG TPA: glutamyl-tRNA reductase [Verrucomicrobiae bacterium]|nr:glutamyl-tRNA reductase [Verrucomicrobiae bacterium]